MLDALAIDITLREGDLVAGAVVLTKIIDASGQVRLGVCWPDGMSWIERLGMLHAAVAVDTPGASDSAAN